MIHNFILSLIILTSTNLSAQELRYKWKYKTVTHLLIQKEEEMNLIEDTKQADENYRLIDSIILQCGEAVKAFRKDLNSEDNALKILGIIDSVLAINRFAICITMGTYSEALVLKPKCSLQCTYHESPFYRKVLLEELNSFYHIDCDLSSFLYFGIAQALDLPIQVFEVPKHNSIRWVFKDKPSLNWDVNLVKKITDSMYRNGTSENSSFSKEKEKQYQYLKNWSQNEILGYYYTTIGRELKSQKKYIKAKEVYEEAIQLRPNHPTAKYCLAYMIIFTGYFNSTDQLIEANKLQKEVVAYDPSNIDFVEALACSYALLGEFDLAIKALNSLNSFDNQLLKAFKKKENGIRIYQNRHNVFD